MREKTKIKLGLVFISCLFFTNLEAQDNHYWNNQFGPTSTFLGGAVTGGVRDNSLLFYNPGAAAFTSQFNLSLQSDALFMSNVYVRDGAGTGINVQDNSLLSIPQLFAITLTY